MWNRIAWIKCATNYIEIKSCLYENHGIEFRLLNICHGNWWYCYCTHTHTHRVCVNCVLQNDIHRKQSHQIQSRQNGVGKCNQQKNRTGKCVLFFLYALQNSDKSFQPFATDHVTNIKLQIALVWIPLNKLNETHFASIHEPELLLVIAICWM